MAGKHIRIAGAGVSGLVAAILLRSAGCDVTVFEKRSDCGERFDGDWQGIENWSGSRNSVEELAFLGIDITRIAIPIHNILIFSAYGSFNINSPEPVLFLVRRGCDGETLDQRLKSIAEQSGVNIMFDHPIRCAGSDVDVLATGPVPRKSLFAATGITFRTDLPDIVVMHLDTRRIASGYSYLLVNEGQATLAVCGAKCDVGGKMTSSVVDFFRSRIAHFKMDSVHKFGGYGVMPLSLKLMRTPLVLGEAAGFQDHLFGFGMAYAIWSAIAAFRHITGEAQYRAFVREIMPSVVATRMWRKVIFGKLRNPAIHLTCALARQNCRSTLRFFYQSSVFTRALA